MRLILLAGLLVGCESLPPSEGGPLAPVASSTPSTPTPGDATPEPVSGEQDGFDFDADAREPETDAVAEAPETGVVGEGGGDAPDAEPVPEQPGDAEPIGEPVADPHEPVSNTPVYAWDPETAPPATWGIRLLSTVNSTLPPRAVIGLPDGTEQVVQPGAMLPEQRLIVMAVGREVIEVAHVEPNGVQARVETQTLESLFPQGDR